jgi:hypothetical protein
MSSRKSERSWRATWAGSVLVLGLLLAGCGGPKTGSVSGRVTLEGDPLPSGRVTFFGEHGEVAGDDIGADGRYTVAKAPVGNVKVTVTTQPPPSTDKPDLVMKMDKHEGTPKEMASDKKYVPIPPRYRDPDKSGLGLTVKEGEQDYNIDLKP